MTQCERAEKNICLLRDDRDGVWSRLSSDNESSFMWSDRIINVQTTSNKKKLAAKHSRCFLVDWHSFFSCSFSVQWWNRSVRNISLVNRILTRGFLLYIAWSVHKPIQCEVAYRKRKQLPSCNNMTISIGLSCYFTHSPRWCIHFPAVWSPFRVFFLLPPILSSYLFMSHAGYQWTSVQ